MHWAASGFVVLPLVMLGSLQVEYWEFFCECCCHPKVQPTEAAQGFIPGPAPESFRSLSERFGTEFPSGLLFLWWHWIWRNIVSQFWYCKINRFKVNVVPPSLSFHLAAGTGIPNSLLEYAGWFPPFLTAGNAQDFSHIHPVRPEQLHKLCSSAVLWAVCCHLHSVNS